MVTTAKIPETLIIERPVPSRHAGQCAWMTYAIAKGEVLSVTGADGRERYQVTVKHIPSFTVLMRVSWKGQLLKILAIVPDGAETRAVLLCEGVA